MKIGIIGHGFVGSAIKHKFKQHFDVFVYDKLWGEARRFSGDELKIFEEGSNAKLVVDNADIIFVCLPTPMYMDSGECDTSIVQNAILELEKYAENAGKEKTIIIKSTVTPGTTKFINNLCPHLNVCFSPEFLTEANAVEDFENQDRIVIGSDGEYQHIIDVFKICFPDANFFPLKTSEAEMVKYTANLFLATKVSFFNDIYDVCNGIGIDSSKVISTTVTDKRIGKSHFSVPGPDGDRGFGGHCFPKDTAAIVHIANMLNLDIPTIKGMWETNKSVRNNKDWEKMEGRAVTRRLEKTKKN